jgi:hypothetical protein
MTSLAALWLPIVVSAVVVFIASSIIHMVLPWHKNEFPALPNEDAVMNALRPMTIPPGEYMVPRAGSMEAMKSPEFLERVSRGPVFILRMMPNGMRPMGPMLGQWFVYLLVVDILAALVGQQALPVGALDHRVFHVIALTSFLGYVVALWQQSIWYARPWGTTVKATIDGIIYAIITALIFVWLWPR